MKPPAPLKNLPEFDTTAPIPVLVPLKILPPNLVTFPIPFLTKLPVLCKKPPVFLIPLPDPILVPLNNLPIPDFKLLKPFEKKLLIPLPVRDIALPEPPVVPIMNLPNLLTVPPLPNILAILPPIEPIPCASAIVPNIPTPSPIESKILVPNVKSLPKGAPSHALTASNAFLIPLSL